ncbi:hypothetical protein BaRGS_00017653 [Batillaria attramentaria]|uniref:RNA polymerase-associated protein LEO1 n=1 Tax=Batillaria attramentaria TaxID=370345 RepID=A0ABD0KVB2_9CAEN
MADLEDLFGSDAESDDGKGSERGSASPASHRSGSEAGSAHSGSPPGSPRAASDGSGSPAHSGSGDGSPPASPRGSESPPGSPAAGSEGGDSNRSAPGSPAADGSAPASPAGSAASGSDIQSPQASPIGSSDKGTPPGSPQQSGSEKGSAPASPAGSGGGSSRGSAAGSPGAPGSDRGSPPASPAGSEGRGSTPHGSRAGSERGSRAAYQKSLQPVGENPFHNSDKRAKMPPKAGRGESGAADAGSRASSPARSRRSSASGSRSPSPGKRSVGSGDEEMAKHSGDEGGESRKRRPSGSASDSGSDVVQKKKRRFLSDDEDNEKEAGSDNENAEATLGDLFGDADDISSDEEKKDEDKERDEGAPSMPMMEDGEEREGDEEAEEPPPETRIEVEIPRIVTDLGNSLHYVKLPNFLSVETRPFDPSTYEDEIEEDEVLDEEGRARTKLRVENTVRWRSVKDEEGNEVKDEFGVPMRESNARVVKWSDGSMSLHLGEEVFDVYSMPLQGNFNHLFVRQGTGLQGQSVFKTKLTFRPHSTDSFTHRKMTMSLADRSTKAQKVKMLPIHGSDPDAHRSEMIKKEEERLRASIRRENQKRRLKERAQARGLSTSYMEGSYEEEEDEEEGMTSISAIKQSYKQKRDRNHSTSETRSRRPLCGVEVAGDETERVSKSSRVTNTTLTIFLFGVSARTEPRLVQAGVMSGCCLHLLRRLEIGVCEVLYHDIGCIP